MRPRALLAVLGLTAALLVPSLGRAHEGIYPILLVHGWTGTGGSFDEMIPKLQAQGFPVLDCNSSQGGTQALTYAPTSGSQHLSYLAGKILQPAIDSCLTANGYATTQKIDIVSHSMGGLTSRFLVEKGWRRRRELERRDRLVRRRHARREHQVEEPGRRPGHARHAEPRHDPRLVPIDAPAVRRLELNRRGHASGVALPDQHGIQRSRRGSTTRASAATRGICKRCRTTSTATACRTASTVSSLRSRRS